MLEMRTVAPEEFAQWVRAEARAYGNRLAVDPDTLRPHFDLDRSIAVFDGKNIVGGAHSHRREMSIPGATAVVAGVANIAVQPTHTRQGVMTRMMSHQIEDIHQRGEALAALFSTESVIYGRFGYGVGSWRERWSIERQFTRFARPHESRGRIVFVDPEDITKDLPEISRRSAKDRPGVFQKPLYHWERESQASEHRQGGQGGLFYAVYKEDGRLDGYVKYRTARPNLIVQELMAVTPEAVKALWRYCFDLDLMTCTEALSRPVDDPLPWMLADPRRLQRTVRDGLWVRLIDAGRGPGDAALRPERQPGIAGAGRALPLERRHVPAGRVRRGSRVPHLQVISGFGAGRFRSGIGVHGSGELQRPCPGGPGG